MKFLLHPLLIVSAVLAVAGVARADEISKSAAVSCAPERAGVGGAILKSIAINGRELALMDVELSDFRNCHSDEPHPARITVTSESDGEYLHVCLGRWSWEEGWRAAECTKAKVVLEAEQLPAN